MFQMMDLVQEDLHQIYLKDTAALALVSQGFLKF